MSGTRFSERFTGRVESYRHFRPRYPEAAAALLEAECSLNLSSSIADIAAGTGLLSELFLACGYNVVAVEPNQEMRAVCAALGELCPQLRCTAGTAEETGLPSASVDLITVAQALHWFDLKQARQEFARAPKPDGWCAVIYNERRLGGDGFHDEYENLLRNFGIDYELVKRQHLPQDQIEAFFAPCKMRCAAFPNEQRLTLEGLEGRILSSSYMPKPGHSRYGAMQAAISALFEKYQNSGSVRLEYECTVSYGQPR